MSRAEPCPVPGCMDFKSRGSVMCRHHWRLVHPQIRNQLNQVWRSLREFKRDGNDTGFRMFARLFITNRDHAVNWVCKQENIHVVAD